LKSVDASNFVVVADPSVVDNQIAVDSDAKIPFHAILFGVIIFQRPQFNEI